MEEKNSETQLIDRDADQVVSESPQGEKSVMQVRADLMVPAHQSAQGARWDTPIIPEIHPSYYVSNSGPADIVRAIFYWSHSFTSKWFEYSDVTVARGATERLSAPGNSLYYSKVVVFNDTDKPAYVSVSVAR
ncbi:TPA: hypothetical protein ACMFPZ_005027 [Pseudomonas aeruginosa]|uniref:JHE-like toxin PirA n=1 Tax=Pseudomonas aeruginosa TaxID=287 RepID=UPI0012FDC448|nr:JHE-like toxin PirA [Pseudomonas aeruginosa]HBN8545359.1 hypothetical protein [Pseudomonas aeruginosa]